MKAYLGLSTKVEDVMTPRSLFKCANEGETLRAQQIAEKYQFDSVPFLQKGAIRKYWSQEDKKVVQIGGRHRILHDTPIEAAVSRLAAHMIQFVYYRTEIVGIIDLSDLNKPVARLTWLRPLLECEQAILMRSEQQGLTEERIRDALGRAAKDAQQFKQRAAQRDLLMPLLGFALFRDILKVAVKLEFIELSEHDILRLNRIRNRSAHVGQPLIEKKNEVEDLIWTLGACQHILRQIG
jgi:hypothetical protein